MRCAYIAELQSKINHLNIGGNGTGEASPKTLPDHAEKKASVKE